MSNALVTFPRAGQHLVVGSLFSYFDIPLAKYCEFYSCCLKFPCSRPNIFLHKSHDFELLKEQRLPQVTIPIHNKHKYIVGIRHPYDCLLSWYKLEVTEYHTRNEGRFLRYLDDRMNYWKRFVDKWVLTRATNIHVFRYSSLVNNFVPEISSIIKFLKPEAQVDGRKLEAIKDTLDTSKYRKDDRRPTRGVAQLTIRNRHPYHSSDAYHKLMTTLGDCIAETEDQIGTL